MEHIKHKLVFIVEDNDMYSLMLDYMLSKDSTCRFVSFKTGEECLTNLAMHPDLIILDYGLPGINGLETFKAIRKFDSDIPVVVLTENRDVHLAQQFLHYGGVNEYLLKEKDSVKQISSIIDELLIDRPKAENSTKNKKKLIIQILLGVLFFISIAIWGWYKHQC